jgi:ABC-type antimicrobial peptide transport system permease subunit
LGNTGFFEVVGVVKDGKYRTLGEAPRFFLYLPFSQNYQSAVSLVARTDANRKRLLPAVQQEVHTLDKSLVVLEAETLEEHMNLPLWLARTTGTLLTAFGALAMTLAIVGIYGVMSYLVAQRTAEIGIRMALGAERGDVLKLVIQRGMTMTLAVSPWDC